MRSKKIILILLILLSTSSNLIKRNYVNEYKRYYSNNSIKECAYSDEYKKWLELSDEDKKKFIMPKVCKNEVEIKNSILPNYSVSVFNDTLEDTIPEKFDLRNVNGVNYVTSVKDQKYTGTCWTFAANASIESNILKTYGKSYDFAEMHMSYYSSKNYFSDGVNYEGYSSTVVGDGGNALFSASYLTKLKGPILETDFPMNNYYGISYGNSKNVYLKTISLSEMQNQTTQADVNDIAFIGSTSCTEEVLNTIKKTIMEKGVIQASYYHSDSYTNGNYIYYNGSSSTNHAISIVGWDDTVSRTNFKSSVRPTKNGAFIIKNSWGTNVGNDGYYYISYEDTNICKSVTSYYNIDFDVEDNAYYHDNLGYIAAINTGSSISYAANKFSKINEEKELLKEVTIGAMADTKYTIYLSKTSKLNERELIGNGYAEHDGYYTLSLENPILIEDDFAIIVKYDSSNVYSIPIQTSSVYGFENTSISSGVSYVSSDGIIWDDLYSYNYIPSIKAYTNTYNYNFNINNPIRLNNKDNFNIPIDFTNITKDRFTFKILDSNNNEVTNEFTIQNNIFTNEILYIEKNSLDTENGIYTLEITYDNYLTKTITFEVIDSYQELKINNINYLPNTIYDDINKIYDNTGGNIKIEFNKHNIDIKDINIEIKNNNTVINSFNHTINNKEDSCILDIIIPPNINYGEYTVKLFYNNIYDSIEFNIYEFIEVDSVDIKYNNNIIDNIVLLKNDSINIETVIKPNNTTIKDIEYKINNTNIANISNNVITGLNIGTTTLTLSIDNISKKINITVIDPKNTINTQYISNITTNNSIDNYYGGEFNTNIIFDNININKDINVKILDQFNREVNEYFTIDLMDIINNKLNIKLKYNKTPNKLSSGIYKVYYNYYLNDIKNTYKNDYYEIELLEYIPIQSINTSTDIISIYKDETYNINDLNIILNPNNSTIKNYTYEVLDSNIVSLENKIITGLNVGNTILRISSENIVKDITINIMEKKYLNFDESLELINKDNTYYLKYVENQLLYSELLNKIYTNYEIKTYNLKKELITLPSTIITTGTNVEINNISYNIVISGEVTGDGKINYLDYVNVYNHIYKTKHPESNKSLLKNEYLLAADVSNEGIVNYLDYVKIYNKIKEIKGGSN